MKMLLIKEVNREIREFNETDKKKKLNKSARSRKRAHRVFRGATDSRDNKTGYMLVEDGNDVGEHRNETQKKYTVKNTRMKTNRC